MNFRMIALASTVVLAVVLPLAVASAGPAGRRAEPGKAPAGDDGTGRGGSRTEARRGDHPGPRGEGGPSGAYAPYGGAKGPGTGDDLLGSRLSSDGLLGAGPDDGDRGTARCGPELTAPEGVEAQTCVLEQTNDTWARTYYRNATGAPLTGVLTLMGPAGRTVQVNCQMAATDDPDMCETPHEPTVRGHGSYAAVAEIASADGRLLLRSGSNSPEPEDG
ncbi:hypothetical protein [Streptomyces griseocarneus]|uniref:hypothetical protein n=2 Tax=Streptomyces griseocarneus TaxID=51201 RepID=UPI001CCB0A3B|nr:hypothetical protein [Streptomyces griseocarneus]